MNKQIDRCVEMVAKGLGSLLVKRLPTKILINL